MGEEFYAVIKLISGEEIFSLVCIDENNGDPIIVLQNPVIMKIIENNFSTIVKVKPWMEIPDDDFYVIKNDKIITITEVKNKQTINFYKKYLNDEIPTEGKVKISDKMGYISTVNDARKKLEKIFKGIKDS